MTMLLPADGPAVVALGEVLLESLSVFSATALV